MQTPTRFPAHFLRLTCLWTSLAMFGGFAGGCVSSQPGPRFSAAELAFPTEGESADRLWEAAQETLRSHHYELDRVDRRSGEITTRPESSQHFFEFWREDVATRQDFWEATLNPIRRITVVQLQPADDSGQSRLAVKVFKQRLSSPDRQFNSSVAAYQVFRESLPSTTGQLRVTAEHEQWLDLGRDPAMEHLLLMQMVERAGVSFEPVEPGEPSET